MNRDRKWDTVEAGFLVRVSRDPLLSVDFKGNQRKARLRVDWGWFGFRLFELEVRV